MNMKNSVISVNEQKQLMLQMMDVVHEFCMEHGIRYSLAYGTLLGAVRHHGFIPWDDDFDIMMPREDYEKFIRSFPAGNSVYQVYDYSNQKQYYYPFAKVVDTRTILKEYKLTSKMDLGVYIDVFSLDYCGNDPTQGYELLSRRMKVWGMLNTVKLMERTKKRNLIKQVMVYLLKALTAPIPHRYILKKMNEKAMYYRNSHQKEYSAAVTVMLGEKEIQKTELFESVVMLPFEEHLYCVPEGYDRILTGWYGNYMVPPRENERTSAHNYTAYWK